MSTDTAPLTAAELDEIDLLAETMLLPAASIRDESDQEDRFRDAVQPAVARRLVAMARRVEELVQVLEDFLTFTCSECEWAEPCDIEMHAEVRAALTPTQEAR